MNGGGRRDCFKCKVLKGVREGRVPQTERVACINTVKRK